MFCRCSAICHVSFVFRFYNGNTPIHRKNPTNTFISELKICRAAFINPFGSALIAIANCTGYGCSPLCIVAVRYIAITYRMVFGPLVSPSIGNLRCDNVISAIDLRARLTVHVMSLGRSCISHKATSSTLCRCDIAKPFDVICRFDLDH